MFPAIIAFPADWKEPPAEVRKAVDEAAAEYGLQPEILYGIAWRETTFNVKSIGKKTAANNATYAKSYAKYKDQRIPGSKLTWGEVFAPEQWAPWGVLQLNPYHLMGKGKPVKAGAPLAELLRPRNQARAAAKLLVQLYKKAGGDWTKAILLYNGSREYRRDVAVNIAALRKENGIA
jgi:soluble lytic murein transglycosylase-like protein